MQATQQMDQDHQDQQRLDFFPAGRSKLQKKKTKRRAAKTTSYKAPRGLAAIPRGGEGVEKFVRGGVPRRRFCPRLSPFLRSLPPVCGEPCLKVFKTKWPCGLFTLFWYTTLRSRGRNLSPFRLTGCPACTTVPEEKQVAVHGMARRACIGIELQYWLVGHLWVYPLPSLQMTGGRSFVHIACLHRKLQFSLWAMYWVYPLLSLQFPGGRSFA